MRLFTVGIAGVVAVAAVGAATARRRLVVAALDGLSTIPTFAPGDRVLVRRAPVDEIHRDQVVVFEEPDTGDGGNGPRGWMIKRVAARPGDPVDRERFPILADRPEVLVPEDHLLVLGDNRHGSLDSRMFGYVPGDRVLGVAVRRVERPGRARSARPRRLAVARGTGSCEDARPCRTSTSASPTRATPPSRRRR